jgi:hypothetical protein
MIYKTTREAILQGENLESINTMLRLPFSKQKKTEIYDKFEDKEYTLLFSDLGISDSKQITKIITY